MESLLHPYSYFVTLTHADDTVRVLENGNMTLDKKDYQDFLNRLRKNVGKNVRYFGVGEYGDKFQRPHYHLAMFTDIEPNQFTEEVKKAWSIKGQSTSPNAKERRLLNYSPRRRLLGKVDVQLLKDKSAQYVAQYTTKKIVSDRSLPDGVLAEFATMSKKPPLGYSAMVRQVQRLIRLIEHTSVQSLGNEDTLKFSTLKNLSQGCFRLNGRIWPYDRLMKQMMIEAVTTSDTLPDVKKQWFKERFKQWSTETAYDINQEAKARHLSLVKTEKWKKEYKQRKEASDL